MKYLPRAGLLLALLTAGCSQSSSIFDENPSVSGNSTKKITPVNPIQSPNPKADPDPQSPIDGLEAKMRIADRRMTLNILVAVFGTSVTDEQNDSAYLTIKNEYSAFGGPCDMQEINQLYQSTPGSNYTGCTPSLYYYPPAPDVTQASLLPESTSIREGYRQRACYRAAAKDVAIYFAAAQAVGSATYTAASQVPRPTIASIQSAFSMFYLIQKPSSEANQALLALSDKIIAEGKGNLEAWRHVLLTLCLSTGWQIL